MQIRQRETLSHQRAIIHEICLSSAQLSFFHHDVLSWVSVGSQLFRLSCFGSAVSHFCISWVSVGSMLDLCWVLVVCQLCLSCVSVVSQLFFSWVSVEFYMGFSWISACPDVLVEYQLSLCKFSLSWVFPIPS